MPGVEIDARLLQADRFADAQSCAVEELDECAVAQSARRRPVRGLDEALGFRRGKRARQRAPASRQVELGRGVVGACAEQRLVAEEGADRGDPSRDRRRRQPGGAELGEVLLELLRRDPADGPVEPGRQRGEVAAVRVDRLRRAPSREQREKAFDFGIELRRSPRRRFRGERRIASRGAVSAQGRANEIAVVLAPFPALNSETMHHGTAGVDRSVEEKSHFRCRGPVRSVRNRRAEMRTCRGQSPTCPRRIRSADAPCRRRGAGGGRRHGCTAASSTASCGRGAPGSFAGRRRLPVDALRTHAAAGVDARTRGAASRCPAACLASTGTARSPHPSPARVALRGGSARRRWPASSPSGTSRSLPPLPLT